MVYILFMIAVSVGGFHNNIIRLRNILGITDQRLILITNVAGKYNFFLAGALSGPYLNGGRTQQMSHIRKTQGQIVIELKYLPISHTFKMLKHILSILHGIEGFHLAPACTSRFPVFPLSFHLLYVGAVLKHDAAQVGGCIGGDNLASESPGMNPRKHACMVNMRVRQKHIVNFMIPHGQLRILVYVISLFHTAVYKHLGISHLQKMTAARYLMVGPDKCKSHLHSPL